MNRLPENNNPVNQTTNTADTKPVNLKTTPVKRGAKKTGNKLFLQGKTTHSRRVVQSLWVMIVLLFLLAASSFGGMAGYFTGQAQRQFIGVVGSAQTIQEQYLLGLQDQQEGRLEIASQRFEWVLRHQADYPGAADRLAEVLAILNATATPSPVPPTITPTPTADLRPVLELYQESQAYFNAQDWSRTIDTLTNLRKSDPSYQVVEVDRMLFLSLRNRGINKVFLQGDLNGGMYDLVLAERFSPLDSEALSAREWARVYLMGSSFWEVYPEQAVYFFRQVANAIPNLRDASGWTAKERLRGALIQWGDEFMRKEDWCTAQEKYAQAAEIRVDAALQAAFDLAVQKCTPPTHTPTPTWTFTPTITTTVTLESGTATPTLGQTATFTPTSPAASTPTPTVVSTQTPPPTVSQTPTQVPTSTPSPPTDTPTAPTSTPDSQGSSNHGSDRVEFGNWVSILGIPTSFFAFGLLGLLRSKQKQPEPGKSKLTRTNRPLLRYVRFILPLIYLGIVAVLGIILASGAFVLGRELALFGTGISMLRKPELSTTSGGTPINPETESLEDTAPPGEANKTGINMPELTPWDGASRVTVLLLGLDLRDWEAGEKYSRSDTMMLLTLDPLTKTAGILSVPRDMWVAIPGFKHGKINTAYYLGDAYKLPGGGPALAVKTVESFLGVPINYYAQIDFDSFIRFIDEIGGVKIVVPEPITIDLLGSGAKTKKNLKPGEQVLPGDHALAYARARYTEGGDFDRAQRQQQVIMGIRQRVLDFNMLPNLISKAPNLYQELSSGIRTNMTIDQVIKLALLAQSVPEENIQRGVLGEKYVQFAQSPDGLSILIPLPDKIQQLRDQIFAASGALAPGTPGNAADRMKAEAPSISVFNGTGDDGLAANTVNWLNENGASAVNSGTAESSYISTMVIDYTGNPFTMKYLVEEMGINPYRIRREIIPGNSTDVELILGSDWKNQQPFQ